MQQKYGWGILLLSIALMGYGCGDRTTTTTQAEPATPDPVVKVAQTTNPETASPEGNLPEELSPSEDALKRLPQVNSGRANPFSSILPSSVPVRPSTSSAMGAASAPVPAPPTILEPTTPIATAPIAPLPAPIINPASPPTQAPAPVAVPAVPAAPAVAIAPPPSLASQIRISGIVQIGNQLNVLVEVPNGGGSRPVRVGEDIISGRVRLARVNVAANQEPQIVLEEGGVETIRTVDSGV